MSRNYYIILGIAADASLDEVKAAFRRRAMDLHPDTSGLGSGPFLELQEAYGVLSDPERRRRYDHQLHPIVARRRPRRPTAEPLVGPAPQPETFRATSSRGGFREVTLADIIVQHRPTFDELFDRFWSDFETVSRPKAERLENLTVEVVVSADEAWVGGRVQVNVPARVICPACGGCGAVGLYECWCCEGHGAFTAEYPVEVAYPPAIQDGYAVHIPQERYGIGNFYLRISFRVSGEDEGSS
jgi:molecular chaperone DnaJ